MERKSRRSGRVDGWDGCLTLNSHLTQVERHGRRLTSMNRNRAFPVTQGSGLPIPSLALQPVLHDSLDVST